MWIIPDVREIKGRHFLSTHSTHLYGNVCLPSGFLCPHQGPHSSRVHNAPRRQCLALIIHRLRERERERERESERERVENTTELRKARQDRMLQNRTEQNRIEEYDVKEGSDKNRTEEHTAREGESYRIEKGMLENGMGGSSMEHQKHKKNSKISQ